MSSPRTCGADLQIRNGNLKYINKKKLAQLFGTDERLLAHSSEILDELHSASSVADETAIVKVLPEHASIISCC